MPAGGERLFRMCRSDLREVASWGPLGRWPPVPGLSLSRRRERPGRAGLAIRGPEEATSRREAPLECPPSLLYPALEQQPESSLDPAHRQQAGRNGGPWTHTQTVGLPTNASLTSCGQPSLQVRSARATGSPPNGSLHGGTAPPI